MIPLLTENLQLNVTGGSMRIKHQSVYSEPVIRHMIGREIGGDVRKISDLLKIFYINQNLKPVRIWNILYFLSK